MIILKTFSSTAKLIPWFCRLTTLAETKIRTRSVLTLKFKACCELQHLKIKAKDLKEMKHALNFGPISVLVQAGNKAW